MLSINDRIVVNDKQRPFILKGINIGGWLMMEGYLLGGRNIPEHVFKGWIAKRYGKAAVPEFSGKFRHAYFNASDVKRIKDLGFNCARLPFNYRLLKEKGGLSFLKKTVKEFANQRIYVILDMHSAPGSQNTDWHSDSDGRACLWTDKKNRDEFVSLWKLLAKTFKDEEWIAGYDIMNESVIKKIGLLVKLYRDAIDAIRGEGDEHIIFLEGNNWGMDIDFLGQFKEKNVAISFHFYQPVHFTFNWETGSSYPGVIQGKRWSKKVIDAVIRGYYETGRKLGMPIYCGEFGLASRCDHCGSEYQWLEDVLDIFKKYGIHWTYWTYKSVKGMKLPDGLFQLVENSGLIGDPTRGEGMDNIAVILKDRKKDFFRIMDTGNYKINVFLSGILKSRL